MSDSSQPVLSQQFAELPGASNDNPLVPETTDHPVPDYPCSVHEKCDIHEECCLPREHGNDCQSINFAISKVENEIAYLRSDVYAKIRALNDRLSVMDVFGVTNRNPSYTPNAQASRAYLAQLIDRLARCVEEAFG